MALTGTGRYDLKQLMIGSEGTLGVVTAVALLCPSAPAAVDTVCVSLPRWHNVIQVSCLVVADHMILLEFCAPRAL